MEGLIIRWVLTLLLVLLVGRQPGPHPGGTLVVGTSDREGLEARLVRGTLASRDPGNRVAGGLAESWQVAEDGRTWTLTLAEGMVLADGTRLTAGLVAGHLRDLARDAAEWLWLEGVEAPDDRTVVLRFTRPAAGVLEHLALPSAGIEGAGPFRLMEQTETGVAFGRNPSYTWGPAWSRNRGPAWLDSVEAVVIADPAEALEALAAGELHVLENLPPALSPLAHDLPGVEVLSRPVSGLGYLALRVDRPPFDDPRLRRAVNRALDRERLAASVFGGAFAPAYGVLPPSMMMALEDREVHSYGPVTARELVAAVAPPPVTLAVLAEDHGPAAVIIGEMLEAAGLTVEIMEFDLAALAGDGWHLALLEYRWEHPDILEWLLAGNQTPHPNLSGLADPELDRRLREAAAAGPADRDDRYREVQRHLMDLEAWAPLWFPAVLAAARTDRVGGFYPGGYLDAWLRE